MQAHAPVRILKRILCRHVNQLFPLFSAERAAGTSEQNFLHAPLRLPVHTLKNRAVFGIHREELYAGLFHRWDDEMPGSHKCLLVRECDGLAGMNGRQCRTDTDHPDDRIKKQVRLRKLCFLKEAVHPTDYAHGQVPHSLL